MSKINIPKDLFVLIILSTILNLGRVSFFEKYSFIFLFWNMFLAFLPFVVSSIMLWYFKKGTFYLPYMIGLFVLWLLFIPNAPYLITDLVHSGRIMIVPVFYDILTLFSSALVGLVCMFYSLSHIEYILKTKYGTRITESVVVGALVLSSFGIYLGRFIRLNSWHVFTDHVSVFYKIWMILSKPYVYREVYVFTAFFFFTLYMLYRSWKYSKVETLS